MEGRSIRRICSQDAIGSSTPSDFQLGHQQHNASRTECLGLCASPEGGVVEASQAEPMPFPADCEQNHVVHSCLDDIRLCKRLRGHHLTRICILGMSLNRVLSSYIPVAD